jgi:hypothetical protein
LSRKHIHSGGPQSLKSDILSSMYHAKSLDPNLLAFNRKLKLLILNSIQNGTHRSVPVLWKPSAVAVRSAVWPFDPQPKRKHKSVQRTEESKQSVLTWTLTISMYTICRVQ